MVLIRVRVKVIFGLYEVIMTKTVNDPVSVTMMYNHYQQKAVPIEIFWQNHHYPITKHLYHDRTHQGNVIKHTFSVMSQDRQFKLIFDAEDLEWAVESATT